MCFQRFYKDPYCWKPLFSKVKFIKETWLETLLTRPPFSWFEKGELDWFRQKAHFLTHALLSPCGAQNTSISETSHQVRWAKGRHSQNSTVSGSDSAERLLRCPRSRERSAQSFCALVERCILGRVQHGVGFRGVPEGGKSVGKKIS